MNNEEKYNYKDKLILTINFSLFCVHMSKLVLHAIPAHPPHTTVGAKFPTLGVAWLLE
jgi:hypothetical protein